MATLQAISEALNLVDGKKENLKKAFEDLQSQSSSLSSFALTWSDLDSYFTSVHSSLQNKFSLLQSLATQPQSQPTSNSKPSTEEHQQLDKPSSSSSVIAAEDPSDSVSVQVPARPDLISLCARMDGVGLVTYLNERKKFRASIRAELVDAWRHAPDAAAMVLDAIDGCYDQDPKSEKRISGMISCVTLMEELREAKVEIGAEVKNIARKMASKWKEKLNTEMEESTEIVSMFCNLLATYELVDMCNADEIAEYFASMGRKDNKRAHALCRQLVSVDKLPDVIQKLIDKGKSLMAIKFAFGFDMTNKFPPVPLLKKYLNDAMEAAQNLRQEGAQKFRQAKDEKDSHQLLHTAISKEINALKVVIKYIDDHNLASEYPKEPLVERLDQLAKERTTIKQAEKAAAKPQAPANKRVPKAAVAAKPTLHQGGNKRPRPAAVPDYGTGAGAAYSSVPVIQQPHFQGAPRYGMGGVTPSAATYGGSSTGMYGSPGFYPSQSQAQPPPPAGAGGNYDRGVSSYGGYGIPPQYHPSYYPQ